MNSNSLPARTARFVGSQLAPGATPGWHHEVLEIRPVSVFGESGPGRFQEAQLRLEARGEEEVAGRERLERDDAWFRQFTSRTVTYDATTGELMRWRCGPAATELGPLRLTDDEALTAIDLALDPPRDHAVFSQLRRTRKLTGHLATAEWRREAGGLGVEGDSIRVVINRTTARIVEYARGRWAPLPALPPLEIQEDDARQVAETWVGKNAAGAQLSSTARFITWNHEANDYLRVWGFWYDLADAGPSQGPPHGEPATTETSIDAEATARNAPVELPASFTGPTVVHVDDAGEVVFVLR